MFKIASSIDPLFCSAEPNVFKTVHSDCPYVFLQFDWLAFINDLGKFRATLYCKEVEVPDYQGYTLSGKESTSPHLIKESIEECAMNNIFG